MNIENAKKLVGQLERLPDEKFWMADFIVHPAQFESCRIPRAEECGTVACIAGWASLANSGPEGYFDIQPWAGEWLGLNAEGASNLFMGRWSDKPLKDITRSEAIAELRRMIAEAEA